MKLLHIFLLPVCLGNLFAGDKMVVSDDLRPQGWSISSVSAGLGWRSYGKLTYRGGSRSQASPIPSQIGGDSEVIPSIGTVGDFADRTYQNGFVNQDASTSANGDTWFWGYDSSSQVEGDRLRFDAVGSRAIYSESSRFTGGTFDSEHLRNILPQIDVVLTPPETLNYPFDGLLVSFWYFGDDSTSDFSNFSLYQTRDDYRIDFSDRYDIGSIQPLIGAPYSGSFDGPGPLLGNRPIDRGRLDVLVGGESAVFANAISTSLDLDGYSLALGPTVSGRINDKWSWQASGGVTLNVFQWSARETESLGLSLNGAAIQVFEQWRDHNSGTDFRLGAYFKGDLIRNLQRDWFVQASLQAEIAGSIDMRVGESTYEFSPRGYALNLGLGRSF